MRSTAKGLGIQVTSTFKPFKDCALGKAKQCAVSKKAVPCLQILGERLFFNISSPSTLTFGRKCHWLLFINDCSDYCWSFFLKEKSDLAQTMSGLVNNRYNAFAATMLGKIKPLREPANRKGWGSTSSIQPQVHLNKMDALNGSLLPFSTGYIACSMAESLPPTYDAVFGQKLRTLTCSSRTT